MRSWKILCWRVLVSSVLGFGTVLAMSRDFEIALEKWWWVLLGLVIMVFYERLDVGGWMEGR